MNIVQIHNKVRLHLDNENSPRHKPSAIDELINTAIALIVDDRYDNVKVDNREKKYSFQSSQKLRDQLYTLVKKTSAPIAAVADTIPSSGYPSDFSYLVSPIVNISGLTTIAVPITYEEEPVIHFDPKRRPSILYPPRVYYIEHEAGFRVIWGAQGTLINAEMYYIKHPASVYHGVEIPADEALVLSIPASEGVTAVPSYIIAVTDCVLTLGGVDNTTLTAGTKHTVATSGVWKVKTGIAVKNFVDCDLPSNLHEEVARRAAALINGTVENFDRKIDLQKEDTN